MRHYLSEIIPRLRKFSMSLDQYSFLIDKPWVVVDNEESFEKLIFRKDGRIHLSINGEVTTGKWEYLSEAQSLLIDYGDRKVLYRHQFMDEAVLALKRDGHKSKDSYYLLANELKIPELDVQKYLKNRYKSNRLKTSADIETIELDGGKWITLSKTDIDKVRVWDDNNLPVSDGIYTSNDGKEKFEVENGFIVETYHRHNYENVTVWQAKSYPEIGDIVDEQKNEKLKVKKGLDLYHITIKNNKIERAHNQTEGYIVIFVLVLLFLLFLAFGFD